MTADKRDALWQHAQGPRRPRSPEYMAGIKATLDFLASDRKVRLTNPHKQGTVQSDAWTAGNREAHDLWSAP